MKVDKFDIGAEIISILTKGMYPDPRDAVREYIQNAIDADAPNVEIKVRQNSVVIEDNGIGMDYKTLRKAIRVGVSDKRPGKDVGFMGIGIYSSFHLCDTLSIYTRKDKKLPQFLEMDFRGMRTLLQEQRDKRLKGEIQSDDLTDLQTLLEKFIKLPEEGLFPQEEYPIKKSGTRIELVGLNVVLDDLLNNFDVLSNYLQDVVPLPFNKKEFKWGKEIENKIKNVVAQHNEKFELINLKLQVGSRTEDLYRPYTNDIFSNNTPLEPEFIEIKSGGTFLGLAWACHNSTRDRILLPTKDEKKRELRGLIMKKQGFSIGNRNMLSKFFGTSNTFYHRYTGEVIIINKEILPNAARNDIESSELKKTLYFQIQSKVAPFFIAIGNKFQEQNIASEVLQKESVNFTRILGEYNPNEDNYNNYILQIGELNSIITNIGKKIKKLPEEDKVNGELIRKRAEDLKKEITQKFEISKKSQAPKEKARDKITQIAKDIANVDIRIVEVKYESLVEMLYDIELDVTEEQYKLLDLIDQKFIKGTAASKNQYYQFLNDLKSEFENGND